MDIRIIATAFWLAFCLALAVLVMGIAIQPEIVHDKKPFVYVPDTSQTSVPGVREPIDKTSLIIQQNVNCWNAIPGKTCGPDRSYL